MRKIKWGVLGYARIAEQQLIPAIERATNSELYAVASRNPEKLQECSEKFAPSKLYSSYEQLLEDPEVEAVYIPLPNSLHKEWTIKAAEHGKHILCEKPIALDAAECRVMIEAARLGGVLLMEAFMYRYTERTRKVKELITGGAIGAIKCVNSTYRFLLTRENTIKVQPDLGGGSLYDVGCYAVNFVGLITGGLPESYAAECVTENGVDVIFSGTLRYPDRILATVQSGFNAYSRIFSEIIGTQGVIEVPDTFLGNSGAIKLITAAGVEEYPVAESDRYGLEVTDFAQAIIDKRQPMLDLDESIRNMQVIEGLLKAAGLRR